MRISAVSTTVKTKMNENTELTKEEKGTIRSLIESNAFKNAVASALPAHLRPDRFVRVAITALTRVPKLAECDKTSFLNCMMQLSQFGLEPDGRNAHLIPFWNSKRNVMECQLIIDYKGLVDLAMRSGKIAYIHADKVCANDAFEYDKGVVKKHEVNFKEPRGDAYAYYALCRFKDGTEKCEAMTKDEVTKIRHRSKAANNGPWVTDFDEMGKKTVFRRLSKWLQLSPEYRDALDADTDAIEEYRFDTAKLAIARPIIPRPKLEKGGDEPGPTSDGPNSTIAAPTIQPAGAANSPDDSPFRESPIPKPKLRKKKEPTLVEVGLNEAEMIKRLAIGNYTPADLIKVATAQLWIDAEQDTLAKIGEEKLGVLLDTDNWQMVMEELQK